MWEEFLMKQDIDSTQFQSPSCAKLAEWIITAMNNIPTSIGWNAWCHEPFSYFPLQDEALEEEAREGATFTL